MLEWIYAGVTGLLVMAVGLTTALPFTRSAQWWVRGWDFPRLQIAFAAFVALVLSAGLGGGWGAGLAACMAVCLVFQLYRVLPLTRWAPKDLEFGETRTDDVVAMALNVEMGNEARDDVLAVIREAAPDILFLMETDTEWVSALEPILAEYDTVIRAPQDDYYGLVFATRLPVRENSLSRLTRDDTPSVFAKLEDRAGRPFHFVGLHPKPPVPGEDTVERDLQTLYAARFARETGVPAVVMGDFNDAAWSDTAEQFKRVGEYLDVRAGRGLLPSFHARHWWFRCPIDQLYITEGIVLSDFRIGRYVGSDHFPVVARIRCDEDEARTLLRRVPAVTEAERVEFDDRIAAYRDELEKVHADGLNRDRLAAGNETATAPPR